MHACMHAMHVVTGVCTGGHAQVSIGMGTLAGSTVMLLTIAWGGSLLVGRCDLNNRVRCPPTASMTRLAPLTTRC